MPLYTSNYLKSLARTRTTIISESQKKMFSANENQQFDIFLSHSFLDREEVIGIYVDLTNMGYTVYVDWIIDNHLDRNNVTKETATLIRKRLKSSKSLLLAISDNANLSKWMPWELGYVDGHTSRCAIVPVSKDSIDKYTFRRVEYLLLYPYVDRTLEKGVNNLWVNEDDNEYINFTYWMSGQNPLKRT